MKKLIFLFSLLCAGVAAEPMITSEGILKCPCPQPSAKNGQKPNPDLLKKLVRCHKGEKAVAANDEGAVTVEVSSLQVGASRLFDNTQDLHGKPGDLIFPVKVTYTVKTHYRTRIAAEINWIRVLNFYVNSFGEWDIASEVPVKLAETQSIPR